MTDRPAEPTTDELINLLQKWPDKEVCAKAADYLLAFCKRAASLTAAKEAAEKETAALKHELDATVCEAETKLHNLRLAHSDLYVEKDVIEARAREAEKQAADLKYELGAIVGTFNVAVRAAAAAEKQCEELRRALEKIADLPTVDADCTLVSAEAVDIACDALGLCRECGLKLIIQGRGCSVCGALASTSPKEGT